MHTTSRHNLVTTSLIPIHVDVVNAADEYNRRPLKKRCRILPAGGMGVSPTIKEVPQDWGIRGLNTNLSAVSIDDCHIQTGEL
jgi:hypothetical protein